MMSYLNLKDRKNLRLTSKRFRDLSYDSSLTKNDKLTPGRMKDLDTLPSISRYVNLNLRNCEITADFKVAEYWKSHGKRIKSIMDLRGLETNNPAFALILSHCPNIEELVVQGFDGRKNYKKSEQPHFKDTPPEFALKQLKRLELLNFANFDGLDVIETIFNDAPALHQLAVMHDGGISNKDWRKIIAFIKKQSNILNELRFYNLEISNNLFIKVLEATGSNLTRLWLHKTPDIEKSAIKAIGKNLKNLRYLSYRRCYSFFDDNNIIDPAVIALPHLTEFNSDFLFGKPIALKKLQNMTSVQLTGSELSAEDLIAAFGEKQLPQLVDLRLDWIKSVDCNVLCKICPNLPKLILLSLNACSSVKGEGMNAICENNKKLRILSMQECARIKSASLRKKSLKHLLYLDLKDVSLTEEDVACLLRNCPKLLRIGGADHEILRERERLRPFAFKVTTIESIDNDALLHIMSYLHLSDRKNLRLTCRRFHDLSYTLSLIKNDVLNLRNIEDLNSLSPTSRYVNLDLTECEMPAEFKVADYWTSHGSVIKSIIGPKGTITNNFAFALILSHCPNVVNLVLQGSDGSKNDKKCDRPKIKLTPTKFNLKKLKQLILSTFSKFEALDLIEIIFNDAPVLSQLAIAPESHKRDISNEWEKIIPFIRKQSNILKELQLYYVRITYDKFIDVLDAAGPNLTRLWLEEVYFSDDTPFKKMCYRMNLEHFIFYQCCGAFYDVIDSVVMALPNLTSIKIDKFVVEPAALMKFQNMTKVHLPNCRLSAEAVIAAFGDKELPQLLELRLDYVGTVNCDVLCKICPNLPNLQCFSLKSCRSVKGKGLNAICRNNKELRILSLDGFERISLRHISFDYLMYLGLHRVPITVEDIESLLENCPKLLRIGGYSDLEHETLRERNRLRPFAFSEDYEWFLRPYTKIF